MKSKLTKTLACIAFFAVVLPSLGAQTLFLYPNTNPPANVTLGWYPVNRPNLTNYNIYVGVGSLQYTNRIACGNVTNYTFLLPTRGVSFYFAVTAQDNNGLESPFSNEVNYNAPAGPPPPTMKPVVVLTVQSSPTPNGTFLDTNMYYALMPGMDEQYFKLRIGRALQEPAVRPSIPQ